MVPTAEVTTSRSEGIVTITGRGEMDLVVVSKLNEALENGTASSGQLAVDLRPAEFIDSAIVQAVAKTAALLLQRNERLRVLVSAGSHPDYVLKVVGLGDLMDVVVQCSETD